MKYKNNQSGGYLRMTPYNQHPELLANQQEEDLNVYKSNTTRYYMNDIFWTTRYMHQLNLLINGWPQIKKMLPVR